MARMGQVVRRGGLLGAAWLAGVGGLLLALPRASAADVETRDFTVQVDHKAAGDYHMTITRKDDGTATMAAQSNIRVTVLGVPVYTYTYRGQEVWKGGKLQQFHCTGAEKGTPFAVTATLGSDGLHVNANGQAYTSGRSDVWLTSYWQLPDPSHYNQPILLMGCDNGQQVPSDLQYVGVEQLQVAGQTLACTHCRVTNKVPYDLWYDGQGRLVRQESVSDGHHALIELARVRR